MCASTALQLAVEVGGWGRGQLEPTVEFVRAADRLGVYSAWAGEAWTHDAATILAYLAAHTRRIRLGTGILQNPARTPAMIAMTALALHDLSDGRFLLGLGASGPQVVEGLHGVAYRKPLTRLRETVEICRLAFAGERLRYQGQVYELPRGGGEGKALRLAHDPVDIPIYLATLAPAALRYTGAAADGWLGTSFSPDHPEAHFEYLRSGAEAAGRTLSELDLEVSVRVEIGEDVDAMIDRRRKAVAFNMGGMGSATTNFYNDAFKRAGFEDDARAIQQLWLDGKRDAAAARVPDAMVTQFQAIGTADMVRERLAAYRAAGVTTVKLGLDGTPQGPARIELLEQITDLVKDIA